MAQVNIPTLVKHVALAIYETGYIKGSKITRIVHSLNIARGRLVEYGFLMPGSQYGSPANIKLTTKGKKRNVKHQRELAGRHTTKQWDKLYALILEGMEEEDGDGATTEVMPPVARPKRTALKKQQRRRATKRTQRASKPKVKRSKAKKARRRRG